MKVGIYFDNSGIADVDLTHPEKGNPGVGATQYLLASFPYYFSKHSPSAVECILYVPKAARLPLDVSVVKARDLAAAAEASHHDRCDVFICLPPGREADMAVFTTLECVQVPTVMWANNTPYARCLDAIHTSQHVKRLVCAGREGMDYLRDHAVFPKSTFIFNGIDVGLYAPRSRVARMPNTVVYLGSLVPIKGFHVLARAWPSIRHTLRDARLLVIGTGDLYQREVRLGKWGIAEESYESQIRSYLSGRDGEPDYGVKFLGRLGAEKIGVLQAASVGVVNPSGRSEICPVSALELQACGTPVVSTPKHGVADTVIDGETGLLGRGDRALRRNIIYLLTHPSVVDAYGTNALRFLRDNFSYQTVMDKWYTLLRSVVEGRPGQVEPVRHLWRNAKFLREASRLVKSRLNLPIPSMVEIGDLVRGRRLP